MLPLLASALLLSLLLTPAVRMLARRRGWLAYPTKDRWHTTPTALLGGIAIFFSAAVPLFFLADFESLWPHISNAAQPTDLPSFTAAVLTGMTLLFILGLLDDFYNIKPHAKLIGQILVASLLVFLGFRLHWFTSMTLDTVTTIVWIVGITNAFNLLDNMDGLCAGIGCIAAVVFAVLFLETAPQAAFTAMVLAMALAGFLVYNTNPATIFMGDCGSLVIGFTIAMLGVFYPGPEGGSGFSRYAVPMLILLVPLFDTTLVTLMRTLSGRKASMGGKDHTSHRLVLIGFSEKRAVLLLDGVAAIAGVAALFIHQQDAFTSPAVVAPLLLASLLMGVYLAQLRVYPEGEFSLLRGRPFTPILMELAYKRQVLMAILDFGLLAFSYYLAYRLRFSGPHFPVYFKVFLKSLPAVIACKMAVLYLIGIYRGIWIYMSSSDILLYLKASVLASILSITAVTFLYRFVDFSKGVFIIDWFLTTALLLGTRGSMRFFTDTMQRRTMGGKRVLIYGAGRGGELLLREILNNKSLKLKPVGFIDDDPLKAGKQLQGYPVLGNHHDLKKIAAQHQIQGLLISFSRESPGGVQIAQHFCKANNLFLKRFSIHLDDVDPEKDAPAASLIN